MRSKTDQRRRENSVIFIFENKNQSNGLKLLSSLLFGCVNRKKIQRKEIKFKDTKIGMFYRIIVAEDILRLLKRFGKMFTLEIFIFCLKFSNEKK